MGRKGHGIEELSGFATEFVREAGKNALVGVNVAISVPLVMGPSIVWMQKSMTVSLQLSRWMQG